MAVVDYLNFELCCDGWTDAGRLRVYVRGNFITNVCLLCWTVKGYVGGNFITNVCLLCWIVNCYVGGNIIAIVCLLCWADSIFLIPRAYLLKFIRSLLMVVVLICFALFYLKFCSNFGRTKFQSNFGQIFKFWFCNFVRDFAEFFEIPEIRPFRPRTKKNTNRKSIRLPFLFAFGGVDDWQEGQTTREIYLPSECRWIWPFYFGMDRQWTVDHTRGLIAKETTGERRDGEGN